MANSTSIYFDTDGAGNIFLCEKQYSGKNVDFVKRTSVEAFCKAAKLNLNKEYGRLVTDTMRKDYIVVHKDGRPSIIFKSFIAGVFDNVLDKVYLTRIELSSGGMVLVDEDYATIVRALLQ